MKYVKTFEQHSEKGISIGDYVIYNGDLLDLHEKELEIHLGKDKVQKKFKGQIVKVLDFTDPGIMLVANGVPMPETTGQRFLIKFENGYKSKCRERNLIPISSEENDKLKERDFKNRIITKEDPYGEEDWED